MSEEVADESIGPRRRDVIAGVRSHTRRHGGAVALFIATMGVNFINFLFQLFVGRELGPGPYGELAALGAVMFVLSVPSAALQVVITSKVAGRLRDSHGRPVPLVIGPLLGDAVVWGLGTTVVLLLLAPLLRDFLHLSSISPALLLALYVLPTMIELVPRAALLGELRFVRVAVAVIVGASVRLCAAFALVPTRGVTGAMAASVIGALVTAALTLYWLRSFVRSVDGVQPIRVGWGHALGAVVAFSGYWIFNSVDVFFGRHFLSDHESGLYAAAFTVASAVMFLPGAVATIALPRFAAVHGRGLAARAALVQALSITLLLSGAAAVVLALASDLVMSLLFGDAYRAADDALRMLAFAAVGMGMLTVLMQFHLSGRRITSASLSWVGIAAGILLIALFHESILEIAVVKLAVVSAVAVLMTVTAFLALSDRSDDVELDKTAVLRNKEPDLDLTMVVPYYNPGDLLRRNVDKLVDVLRGSGLSFEVIAVSDGATDGSEQSLIGLDPSEVRSVVLPSNGGKGQALRAGFALGRGRYLGFIDADGDVDPSLLEPYIALMRLYEPDVVLGSKRHPMSEIHYPRIRRIYSWGYQQVIRVLFRLNIRDTQTGLKIMRRDVLADVLPRMVEKRFAFDLELFVVAQHLGYRKFFEAPVRIEHQFSSTVSGRAVQGTLLDTLAIFYRLHLLGYYDEPRHDVNADTARPPDRADVSALPRSLG